MKPASRIEVKLEKPVYGGDCLGRLPNPDGRPGKTVFVPLALPGETVSAHLAEEKRNYMKAELDRVLAPSPSRVAPHCAHFGSCGGCHYQHADYATQLKLKQEVLRETLTRGGNRLPAEIATLSGEPWGYRNRIRLAFTPSGQLAYRGRGSHDLIAVRQCPIAAPVLEEIVLDLSSLIGPEDCRKDLSEIELFLSHDNSELLVTLSTHSGDPIYRKFRLTRQGSLPRPEAEIDHKPFLDYHVAGQDYRVPHAAFFQVNRHLVDDFATLVTAGQHGSAAWDLFAGVGLFARRLARDFSRVVAVESAPASQEALVYNLTGTGAETFAATTLDFLRRNREQREPRPDLIVLDPPRAGLGEDVTTLLNAIGAAKMVYVSCDPTTLARDLRALTLERYRIDTVTLADMFPQTYHIETVVCLSRA